MMAMQVRWPERYLPRRSRRKEELKRYILSIRNLKEWRDIGMSCVRWREGPPGNSRVEGRCSVFTLNMSVKVGLLPQRGKEVS